MTRKIAADKSFIIDGNKCTAKPLATGLYVVATPIGNLADITLRALQTLAAADLILCEDTRQSAKLLNHYGISTKMQALHEHNERERAPAIVEKLKDGTAIALISDAGTPLVSDPGFPLVRAVREAGQPVFAVPGASAVLSALAVAGLPTDRFSFQGFLPPKSAARKKAIAELETAAETLVFYESPRRLAACLADMTETLGQSRPAAVALELTKRFERVFDGALYELAEKFAAEDTKGEAVILVGGANPDAQHDPDAWQAALVEALKGQPLRMAVDDISQSFGVKRKQVYDAALALKNQQ